MAEVQNYKAVIESEKNTLRNYAASRSIPYREWDLDSNVGLEVLQPFLQQGFINDPDFAISKSGIDIYNEMYRDDVIGGSLDLRYKAVSSLMPDVVPDPDGTPEIQDRESKLLGRIIRKIPKRLIWLKNIQKSIFEGSSYNEIIWSRAMEMLWDKSRVMMAVPSAIKPMSKQRIIWSNTGDMRIKTINHQVEGEKLVPRSKEVAVGKIMVSQYDLDDTTGLNATDLGYQYHGRGLGDSVWRVYYIKYNCLGQASRLGERQATGIILVTIPKGKKEETDTVAADLLKMRKTGVLIMRVDPNNAASYKIDYLDPPASGKEFLLKLIEMCDNAMRSRILGQNLTAPGAAGSGTAGAKMVLRDVMLDIKLSDIALAEETCNTYLVRWIRRFNPSVFDLSEPDPKFKLILSDQKDIQSSIQKYDFCARNKLVVNTSELYESLELIQPPDEPEWKMLDGGQPQGIPDMTGNDIFG